MSGLSWSRKDFSNRTYQKMLVNYLVFNTNEFWSRSALVCSKIFPEWLQDQTQRTKYCLQRPQKSKVIKEETLLLIQIDGQTNWTKEKSDLNESRIGEYSGTVKKGLPHGQGQLCYSHGGKYIGSWKDGKRNGLGTYTYSDGRVSTGNYKNGKKNGNVKIECPNGDIYEGDFINGSPSGKFTYTNTIGEISEIDFKRLKNPSITKEWTPSSSLTNTEDPQRPSDSNMV